MTTTAQELSANIGKTATLNVAGTPLSFSVVILDARKRYGNLDYKVKPVAGEGEAWHQSTAIVLDNNQQMSYSTTNNKEGQQ